MLLQLYRETRVALRNLLPNEVALRVIAASLSERTGGCYTADGVKAQFERLAGTKLLPKLPNDTAFVARNHVTTEGKRYVRTVKRWAGRDGGTADGAQIRQAM